MDWLLGNDQFLHGRSTSRMFLLADLFAHGEQGTWHETADLSTIFQDHLGMLLGTYGQPAGLTMDKSVALGPERVPNGNFTSTAGWNTNGSWTISDGAARFEGSTLGGINALGAITTSDEGKTFEITFTKTGDLSGNWRLGNGGTPLFTLTGTQVGTYTARVVATRGTDCLFYRNSGTGTITNVSVREIPGVHARQPTTTARPTVVRMPKAERRNLLRISSTLSSTVWLKNGGATVAGTPVLAPDGTMTASRVQFPAMNAVIYTQSNLSPGPHMASVWMRAETPGQIRIARTSSNADGAHISVTTEWKRYEVLLTPTSTFDGPQFRRNSADQLAQVDFWCPQFEAGTVATPYQHIVSPHDITEEGVPSYTYLSFDGIDDKLDMAFPEAVNGDMIIAGRLGTWIKPINVPAGGTLSMGAGETASIIKSVGEIVGWLALNRAMTDAECRSAVDYYGNRGAGDWINSLEYYIARNLFQYTRQGAAYVLDQAADLDWRRNLLVATEDFTNSAWLKNGLSAALVPAVIGTVSGPEGVGAKIVFDCVDAAVAANRSMLRQVFSNTVVGAVTTMSLWIRAGTPDDVGKTLRIVPENMSSASGSTIITLSSEWTKVILTATPNVTTTTFLIEARGTYTSQRVTADIACPQWETSPVATPYQPITTLEAELNSRFPSTIAYAEHLGVNQAVPGQSVGLALDGHLGLVKGPELLRNRDFTTDTEWAKGAGWSVANGLASCDGTQTGNTNFYQNNVVEQGKTYEVVFTVSNYVAGTVKALPGGINQSQVASANGTYRSIITNLSATRIFYMQGDINFKGSIDDISVREIPGQHALQPTTTARPTLGRVPRGGRRNLVTLNSDLFEGWSTTNITRTTVDQVVGPFTQVAEIATGASRAISFIRRPVITSTTDTHCVSFYVPSTGGNTTVCFVDEDGSNTATFRFDPATGAFTAVVRIVPTATAVTGGWLVEATYSKVNSLFKPDFWVTGYGASDPGSKIRVAGLQLERGTRRSGYQRVTSDTDITEAGVPSQYFLRPDYVDDVLTTTFPTAVAGDLLIAGRNGSWIEPVSIAAGGNLNIGPTTFTGGAPGILRAVGDIVGWTVIDKTLSEAERAALIGHYKEHGAKGLLVPGPSLVPNSTFTQGTTGWDLYNATAEIVNGSMVMTMTGSNYGAGRSQVFNSGGGILWLESSGLKVARINIVLPGTTTSVSGNILSATTKNVYIVPANTDLQIFWNADNNVAGTTRQLDPFVFRELIPQE